MQGAAVEDRREAGRALRKAVARSAHASAPVSERDPVALVLADNEGRDADLVPVRHHRMAVSAFTFYRGTASLMALDLATTPTTGVTVQTCGDAHLSNFGFFATPERRLTFDLNDFDETHPGPWEWDLKRLAASVHLAAEAAGHGPTAVTRSVEASARWYRDRMATYATRPTLDVWFDAIDLDSTLPSVRRKGNREVLERVMRQARRRTNPQAVARLTHTTDEGRRFRDDLPLMWRLPREGSARARVDAVMARYRSTLAPERGALLGQFELVDAARKVVGVGSVGTRCWLLLLQGPQGDDDVVILQAKEAGPAAFEPYTAPSIHRTHGERVVMGQRLMQAAGDPFLGHTFEDGWKADAYVRQLWDMKGSIEPDELDSVALEGYASICGAVLARAHARSGRAAEISGYLGGGPVADHAIAEFARHYAARAREDHAAFVQAIADGRVEASPDRVPGRAAPNTLEA